ncbi:hypothetical protein [Cupriavidus sp. 2MCAB6]|uniref:hypothetical protein n=1 Tax=Cupriavidus sp. 2MCAB6 TaxID=3232981 RepID=UPI003F920C0C
MLGFEAFRGASILPGSIEITHMVAKGQTQCIDGMLRPQRSNFIPWQHQLRDSVPGCLAL